MRHVDVIVSLVLLDAGLMGCCASIKILLLIWHTSLIHRDLLTHVLSLWVIRLPGPLEIFSFSGQVFLDVRPERCQQRIQAHLSLVTLKGTCIAASVMFECDECLEELAVFLSKIVAIRVLLDFALSGQTFTTAALEWIDLVA